MSAFKSLLKVQLLSVFGINKMLNSKKKNKTASLIGGCFLGLLVCALIVFMGYVYANSFAGIVATGGTVYDYLSTMCGMCFILCLVLGVYEAGSLFYGNKDYDYLSALPVKNVTVICSKILIMYLSNILFTVFLLAPTMYVCFTTLLPFDIALLLRVIIIIPFLAIIPLAISMLIGSLVSLISTLFRRKRTVQTAIYTILFLAVYLLAFVDPEQLMAVNMFSKIYPLYNLSKLGYVSWGYTALYCAIGIVAFVLVLLYSSATYKWINTRLLSTKRVKNFRLKQYSAKGLFSSLYKKEIGRLFSSSLYAMNSLIGCFMAILSSIVVLVLFGALKEQIGIDQVFINEVSKYLPAVIVFMFTMAPPTCCSLSIEGNNFWIMRTSPIPINKLFNAKILTTLTFTLPSALVSSILMAIGVAMSFVWALTFVVMAVSVALFSAVIGLWFNLISPQLNWKKEAEVVKQGLAVLWSVIATFVLSGIAVGLSYLLTIQAIWIFVILTVAFLASGAIIYINILKNSDKYLRKIE